LKADRVFAGFRFGLGMALYAAARLAIEMFRGDSAIVNGVRIAQVWSLAILVGVLCLLRYWAASELTATTLSSIFKVKTTQD
jgi:prolipoprotein diacylglyceryltransferase